MGEEGVFDAFVGDFGSSSISGGVGEAFVTGRNCGGDGFDFLEGEAVEDGTTARGLEAWAGDAGVMVLLGDKEDLAMSGSAGGGT